MSLSRRLVLILLGLSAVGLLTLGLVSYLALRSYLSDRLDDQARDALPLVGGIVEADGPGGPPVPAGPGQEAPEANGETAPEPPSGFPPADGGGDFPGPQLPTGTYAEVRGPNGEVTDSQTIGDAEGEPDLPDSVPVGDGGPT